MQIFKPLRLSMVVAWVATLLVGCATVGPDDVKPQVALPEAWQAPRPHGGQLSQMADWWAQFKDPVLAELQRAAQADSPSLAKAAAAIQSARATVTVNRSAGLPSVSANASSTRSADQTGVSGTSTVNSAGLDASWEIDLFGSVRRNVESGQASLQAKQADWHDARISLAAEVAGDYLDYRACRLKQAAYQDQALSYRQTLKLTHVSVQSGLGAPSDLMLAQAGAASASANARAQQASCDLLIKTLVAATGLAEPQVRSLLGEGAGALPSPADFSLDALPASVIAQRPDVISAERQVASTLAKIGVAEANRWPTFTITGSIAAASTAGVASTPWSLVPAISLPIFQGGALRAKVNSARADYDSALASYKSTVRNAVLEVEQALVNLDSAADRERDAQTSAEQYRHYVAASETSWRAGLGSLQDLETARRSYLSAELTRIELQQSRVTQWITLYKAIGGGWQSAQAPGEKS